MTALHPPGFLALPPSGTGPAVLVLHAWWGLNETIQAFCTRLAGAGFTAFAPDLYHGKVADTIPGAEALAQALDARYLQARAEVRSAADHLFQQSGQPDGQLAVVGFSLGAFYALDLANAAPEHVRAVVIFYGSGAHRFEQTRAAFLGHFAENDPYEPLDGVEHLEQALKQAGLPVDFHIYPHTGHWFIEPDRESAYNPAAAALAWERTLAFLQKSFPVITSLGEGE